jgi:hypothetical protein
MQRQRRCSTRRGALGQIKNYRKVMALARYNIPHAHREGVDLVSVAHNPICITVVRAVPGFVGHGKMT